MPGPVYPADAPGWARLIAPEYTFDSTGEAEQWTTECWPHITVDFSEMHPECLTPFLAQLHRLAERWPEVMGRLAIIQPVPEWQYRSLLSGHKVRSRGQVYAQVSGHRVLELDPVHFGTPDHFYEDLAREIVDGWSPYGCATIQGVASHEFGHLLDSWLTAAYWGEHANEPEAIPYSTAFAPYASLWQEFGLIRTTVARFKHTVQQRQLSGYASKRKHDSDSRASERFAEGFASYIHTPASMRNPYATKLGTLLEAVDRAHWRAVGEFSFLHELEGAERERGVELLEGYVKDFGMRVELLKPAAQEVAA